MNEVLVIVVALIAISQTVEKLRIVREARLNVDLEREKLEQFIQILPGILRLERWKDG